MLHSEGGRGVFGCGLTSLVGVRQIRRLLGRLLQSISPFIVLTPPSLTTREQLVNRGSGVSEPLGYFVQVGGRVFGSI